MSILTAVQKVTEHLGGLNRPSFFLRKEDCYGV